MIKATFRCAQGAKIDQRKSSTSMRFVVELSDREPSTQRPSGDRPANAISGEPTVRTEPFAKSRNRPLYQTWLNQRHSALRTLLKMPADFVPHSFRHTFGTR
jgi:hypothetical protein